MGKYFQHLAKDFNICLDTKSRKEFPIVTVSHSLPKLSFVDRVKIALCYVFNREVKFEAVLDEHIIDGIARTVVRYRLLYRTRQARIVNQSGTDSDLKPDGA